MELGEQAVVSEAAKFGISTRVPPVPSIHIGSADVIPLEMIAAYTTFANLGTRTVPNAILRVEDRTGRIVWQPTVRSVAVMDSAHAWLMTDVLRDVVRHGTAVGSVGARINFPAGGKTGTTNDGFDVWYIGFTPDLVTGVWIGFDQPKKIKSNAQGGVLAAPAWTAMMREVYERRAIPARLAPARRTHRAGYRQDHRVQGDPVLPQGRPLHRIVHPGHRAQRLLPDPLALRLGGRRDGRVGSGPTDGASPSTAPAVGAPPAIPPAPPGGQPRTGGPPRQPASPPPTGTGAMGGTGPSPISQ